MNEGSNINNVLIQLNVLMFDVSMLKKNQHE